MFVHANFDHLFWNMLVLFFFGMELEKRVGETKFLEIYVLSGIVAALGQMMISGGSLVGASGAIYGVMGCLAIIAPEIRVLLFFVIPLSIRAAVVLFALIDFLTIGILGQHCPYGPYRRASGRIGLRAADEETAPILLIRNMLNLRGQNRHAVLPPAVSPHA